MAAQDIPQLPDSAVDSRAKQPLQRMQQELRRLMGFSGDVLDMAVTYQALLDAGIISVGSLKNIRPGSGTPPRGLQWGGGSGGPGSPGAGEEPDLTPPPNLTGLAAVAGITSVIVTWDVAGYTVGHGPGQVNLYVALRAPGDPLPTFLDASLFYSAPHALTIAALTIEPNTRVHIWAKHQTVDGVESPTPAGGTNGVTVTTGQDVSHLLAVLSGAISQSELQAALSARIDLIDADDSVPGSVDARLKIETDARIAADSATASSLTTVQSRVDRVVNYRIQSWGYLATVGESSMTAEDGTVVKAGARSYNLVVLDGSTGAVVSSATYDVFASTANAAALAADLDALTADKVVVVFTHDEPQGNSNAGSLRASLRRCGASSVVQERMAYRGAYILVGIPGIGEGGGIERASGTTPSDPNAWVEYTLQLVNGRPVALGGNPQAAAVQQEISTRIGVDNHMSALYGVRVQLTQGGRTVMGGFGVMGTSSGTAGPTIDFGVLANRFYIGAPVGSTGVSDIQPFVVQTTDETINGVVIPRGVYMDAAYIKNLTAMVARLGIAWIDNAMIASMSAAKITAGAMQVGAEIRSTSFTSGSTGWIIRANGTAEFAAASIRGQLLASQIDTRDLTIKDAGGTVIFSASQNLDIARVAGKGAFATLSQITGANVSTYIANAAIGTAQVGSLNASVITAGSITTDKILVGAATASADVGASGGSVSIGSSDTSASTGYFTSLSFTTTGAYVKLMGRVYGGVIVNNAAVDRVIVSYSFRYDSTVRVVRSFWCKVFPIAGGVFAEFELPLFDRLLPSAGTHAYSIDVSATWRNSSNTAVAAGGGSLVAYTYLIGEENKV